MFQWNKENELLLLKHRDEEKKSFSEIAKLLETTTSSVKHKYTRLKQKSNEDKYHHPIEKTEQIEKLLWSNDLRILETNSGWGNLTKVYNSYGKVTTHDIDGEKVKFIASMGMENVDVVKCDSFKEIYKYIYKGLSFDVIDLDPYGFPSRYFPYVFQLINDGILIITFPKMGVQQINKIMVEHYRIFWDIELDDKNVYVEKIHKKIIDYGMCYGRSVTLVDTLELDRVYRFAYRVEKKSMLDIVGLKVKGVNY